MYIILHIDISYIVCRDIIYHIYRSTISYIYIYIYIIELDILCVLFSWILYILDYLIRYIVYTYYLIRYIIYMYIILHIIRYTIYFIYYIYNIIFIY